MLRRFLAAFHETPPEPLPTGLASFDELLGGGLPLGALILLQGVGSRALALRMSAAVQHRGRIAAYLELEHAFAVERARALGVELNDLLFAQPDSAELALRMGATLLGKGAVGALTFDGLRGCSPEGLFALEEAAQRSAAALLFTAEESPARAVRLAAALAIELRPAKKFRTTLRVVKSATSPLFREVSLPNDEFYTSMSGRAATASFHRCAAPMRSSSEASAK